MNQHVSAWLPAYHDRELSANRKRQVETHLLECDACRAELEALEGLSTLLQADPAPAQTSPERFAAQVQLRLPHASPPSSRPGVEQLPRWLLGAPLLGIIAWAFLQAALWVTTLLLSAGPLLGLVNLFPGSLIESLGDLLLLNIILLVGAAILWAAWMAFWWAWQHQSFETNLQKEV